MVSYRENDRYIELFIDDRVRIIFTTKDSGNMSFKVPHISSAETGENRYRLLQSLNISPNTCYSAFQTHSSICISCDEQPPTEFHLPASPIGEADALMVGAHGQSVCVTWADCIPFTLYDPVNNACAVVHAGWKGLMKGIAIEVLNAMNRQYGSSPNSLFAIIGPSIDVSHFEVRTDFIERLHQSNYADILSTSLVEEGDRLFFDNRKALLDLLVHCGCVNSNFFELRLDTFSDHRFSSYRADRELFTTQAMICSLL